MKSDSDTAIAIEFRKQLVKQKINIDTCKECEFFKITKEKLNCMNEFPSKEDCNLLKIHM